MPQVKTSTAILSKDPYRLYIRIEGDLPKAMNKVMRSHWGKNYSQANKWKLIIGNAVECYLPPDLLEYVDIAITRHSHRALDFDGLVASMKPLVDGLKDLVIQDDRWRLTGPWRVGQKFRPKKDGSLLELWVCEKRHPEEMHG